MAFEKLKSQIDFIQKSVDSTSVKVNFNSDDFIKKHAPNLPNLNTKLEQFKSKLTNKKNIGWFRQINKQEGHDGPLSLT